MYAISLVYFLVTGLVLLLGLGLLQEFADKSLFVSRAGLNWGSDGLGSLGSHGVSDTSSSISTDESNGDLQ